MRPDDDDPEFYVNALCRDYVRHKNIEDEDIDFKSQEIDEFSISKFRNLSVFQRSVIYIFPQFSL